MKQIPLFHPGAILSFLWMAAPLEAATPPPEQLLPADTVAVLSAPDWGRLRTVSDTSAMWQLWRDPAMAPFRRKLETQFKETVLDPLESRAGISLAEYASLLQGQITFAVTRNGWTGSLDPIPGLLVILDAGDKADLLRSKLAEVRRKIADSGEDSRTREIRGVEFTELPGPPPGSGPNVALRFGQAGSLLIVNLNAATTDVEKVLARLAGGAGVSPLAEQPAFQADQRGVFRNALVFGWIHSAPLIEIGIRAAAEASRDQQGFGPKPDAILNALGLTSLKSLAFSATADDQGEDVHLFLGSPEADRRGLFRLPVSPGADATPPAFVPEDAAGFSRARLSGPRLWETITAVANGVAPGMLDFGIASLEAQIKERNPNFDFRRDLIGSLGDDLIAFQKSPRQHTLEALNAQPSITLIASPNPNRLLDSLKSMVSASLGMTFEQREFLGRTIHSLMMPFAPPGPEGPMKINLCVSGGYLAVSMDAGILEEYVRSADSAPRPLSGTAGLAQAAEKVGGMRTGFFGYQNDRLLVQAVAETLRQEGNSLLDLMGGGALAGMGADTDGFDAVLGEWLDFSLLPSFDRIAKYFHFTVYAGQADAGGFNLRMHSPKPPGLR